jgi:hypothetical protein
MFIVDDWVHHEDTALIINLSDNLKKTKSEMKINVVKIPLSCTGIG